MAFKPMDVPEFTFLDDHKIIRKSLKEGGWNLEFNHMVWNNGEPKYDIRAWSPDHKHMAKGIGLSEDDCKRLRNILVSRFGPEDDTPVEIVSVFKEEESPVEEDSETDGSGLGEDVF